MTNNNKEQLKIYLTQAFQGNINREKVKEVFGNYSREDWKKLLVIAKEEVKETLGKEATEMEAKMTSEELTLWKAWEGDIKNLLNASIDFYFTILNENLLYEIMQIEKQALNDEGKMRKIIPVFISEMNKITTRINASKPSINYSLEKGLIKKTSKIVGMVKRFMWLKKNGSRDDISKKTALAEAKKFLAILKSFSVEEIGIIRWKLNSLLTNYVNHAIHSKHHVSDQDKQLVKAGTSSLINFFDATGDNKITKDLLNLVAKFGEIAIEEEENGGFDPSSVKGISKIINKLQERGMEQDLRNLMVNAANHLNKINKLAGETPTNLSHDEEAKITQNILSNLGTPSPNDNAGNPLTKNFMTDLGKIFTNSGTSEEFDWEKALENTFTKTEIKPKWYQRPWVVGSLIVGGVIVGGLIVWLFLRNKKTKVRPHYN